MIEIRILIKTKEHKKEKVMCYRYRVNMLEIGLHEPIWSDWLEMPVEEIIEDEDQHIRR